MNYETLEGYIVARLAAFLQSNAEIIPLPEMDPDVKLPSIKGKITVAYNGSDYEGSETSDFVVQPEKISFQVIVQSRKLRGNTGVYTLLSGIQTAILGWKTPVTDKIQFGQAKYVAHENGVWVYSLTLSTMSVAIEEPDDEDLVISRKLTAVNESHEEITVESEIQEES